MADLDPAVTETGSETNFPNGLSSRGRPVPTDEEVQAAIAKGVAGVDTLAELGLVSGSSRVTGALSVDTGLTVVDEVVVSFGARPSANAAFADAVPGAVRTNEIDIEVLRSDFGASGTEIVVRWIAIGTP